jgi:transposase InsO family protein
MRRKTGPDRSDPAMSANNGGAFQAFLRNIIEWRGCPKEIRRDNGPEYVSGVLQSCAMKKGIRNVHIQPGKPH